jgi:nucleotide-binding universal stress UspA family protein
MYRTILVPLDRSECDGAILEHVRDLARLTGGRVVLMHVAEGHVARNQETLNLADSEEMAEARRYLDAQGDELRRAGLTVDVKMGRGEPAAEILKVAAEVGADLIAMATHGHRLLADLVLGSVANEIRHRTAVPVLLLRAGRE